MGSYTRTSVDGPEEPKSFFFRSHGWTKTPALVQWMTTARCDLTCAHCFAHAGERAHRELSTDQALRLVDEVADIGVSELLLTGGEPLCRSDLPQIVERLTARRVSYSLNTARMPRGRMREALERHPPGFVAVSLDGPRQVHDAFRGLAGAFDEALSAMDFYKRLGAIVAAGTAITRANIGYLTETLRIVVETGAHVWGLHPLVPEGRASSRPDLFPSRRQLRSVLRFVARTRNYFPVELTDELGHCGDLEPLLRSLPMTCGAGRVQCVVLPDGEVVPCTSLDRTASAGNVTERSLRAIWDNGFAEHRRRTPRSGCSRCEYFSMCQGGCWLQRSASTRCFRDIWEPERRLVRAAGVAVSLGLAACSSGKPDTARAPAQPPAAAVQVEAPPPPVAIVRLDPSVAPAEPAAPFEDSRKIEEAILRRAIPRADGDRRIGPAAPEDRANDPAWRFLASLPTSDATSGREQDPSARLRAIREALATRERSLGVAALAFRVLCESLLDAGPPAERSEPLRRGIRDTLATLDVVSQRWYRAIFEQRLPSFLAADRLIARSRPCARNMAGGGCPPPRPPSPTVLLAIDTDGERWRGNEAEPGTLEAWLAQHPHGEGLRLLLSPLAGSPAIVSTAGALGLDSARAFDIHELLVTPASTVRVGIGWQASQALEVTLPPHAELTWVDLLRLADEQHREAVDVRARSEEGSSKWAVDRPHETDPRLVPAMRRLDSSGARWWLADLWLY